MSLGKIGVGGGGENFVIDCGGGALKASGTEGNCFVGSAKSNFGIGGLLGVGIYLLVSGVGNRQSRCRYF